jgi:hypothetical protein
MYEIRIIEQPRRKKSFDVSVTNLKAGVFQKMSEVTPFRAFSDFTLFGVDLSTVHFKNNYKHFHMSGKQYGTGTY